jgi:hypothetical protein
MSNASKRSVSGVGICIFERLGVSLLTTSSSAANLFSGAKKMSNSFNVLNLRHPLPCPDLVLRVLGYGGADFKAS